jgi:ADP-ribose pyrophosphatase
MKDQQLKWTITSQNAPIDFKIFSAYQHHASHDASAREGHFTVIDSPDWVNIIALTADEHVVFVRQYRHGTGQVTLELPGGMVDPGEDFRQAGARELREETGYCAHITELLGIVDPNPAFMNNRCGLIVARNVYLDGPQDLDCNEVIEVVTHPLCHIRELIVSGQITHSLVVSAFYFLHSHLDR